ncbi:hypothetical protein GC163_02925 [bacterium]|nr:hypothetical protein [bacterium]
MHWEGLILVAGGAFSIAGAACDWEWFMNHHKTQFFVAILGRTGARIFYGILGAALAVFGILILAGTVQ